MANADLEILQYIPFKSFVSPTFWHKLAEVKIDVDKLSDDPKQIFGFYTNNKATDCLMEVDYSAFNSDFQPPKNNFTTYGTLINKNTVEEFKDCNKSEILAAEGKKLYEDIISGASVQNPRLLSRLMILSFADLKTHNYYYWFAFPAPKEPTAKIAKNSQPKKLSENLLLRLTEIYNSLHNEDGKAYFILKQQEDGFKYFQLKDLISNKHEENFSGTNLDDFYFCFADPSEYDKPSWLLRSFIYFLFVKCPNLHSKVLNFLGVRLQAADKLDNSLIWKVKMPESLSTQDVSWIGWEPNQNGKMGPRCAAMANSMDPIKLAENSVNLNLKLMKWRLLPKLDLKLIENAKCLLLGAGTLGCAVARSLLGWGFKTITFLDSGKVSLSNPVRQYLYLHEDAVSGKKMKATTAAERVKDINPSAIASGYALQIPMPGHTIGESLREGVLKDLKVIEDLIKSHDVIFLLTDSRESRWLPTLLGAFHKKIVMNAALGFDSYLVMRHGSHKDCKNLNTPQDIGDLKVIAGSELGCYFCNDVTAPGNSMKDRTLDQQCTVTRPGVSNIAGSYAVELLVALLQHENKDLAPAYYSTTANHSQEIPEGLLGVLPHSIRGSLTTFSNILPATTKFAQCIACSEKVLKEFEARGYDFLFDVFETDKYLEDLTGINQFEISETQIIEFEDSDNWSD